MGLVCPKCSPVNMVWELEYMFPIKSTESAGYPKSLIMANSRGWSSDPNAFLKSMYSRNISWFVNLASSRAAMRICSCLDVLRSARKPSWLSCKIWCFSPYAERISVRVLVKSLYMVFASAMGRWLGS